MIPVPLGRGPRRVRHIGPMLALALLAALGVTSCGSSPSTQTATGAAPQQEQPAADHANGRPRTVTALDGSQVSIPTAGTVTVAYFFAPGCATCIPATKQIAQAQRQAGKARFVALNLVPDVSATALRSFLRSAGNPQLPVVKSGVALAQAQQVTALGTTVVYGPDGQEVFRGVDASASTITTAVQKARS